MRGPARGGFRKRGKKREDERAVGVEDGDGDRDGREGRRAGGQAQRAGKAAGVRSASRPRPRSQPRSRLQSRSRSWPQLRSRFRSRFRLRFCFPPRPRLWCQLRSRFRFRSRSGGESPSRPWSRFCSLPLPLSRSLLRERERGSATVWAIGVMVVVFVVAGAVVLAGMTRVARHRARSAADLSALAAARLALADPERGCAEASSLAVGNGARLVRCSVDDHGVADVQVVVRLSLPVLGGRDVGAEARAGPVYIAPVADPAEGSGRRPDLLARSRHGDSGVGLRSP